MVNIGSFEVDITNLVMLFTDDDNDEFIFKLSEGDSQENLVVDFTEDRKNHTLNG